MNQPREEQINQWAEFYSDNTDVQDAFKAGIEKLIEFNVLNECKHKWFKSAAYENTYLCSKCGEFKRSLL